MASTKKASTEGVPAEQIPTEQISAEEKRVRTILSRHGLSDAGLHRSPIGFINTVYLADGCVVKLFGDSRREAWNKIGYQKERWLYAVVRPDFAPRLLAEGKDYLVLERIRGRGLYRIWPRLNDGEREKLVRKTAEIVRRLAEIRTEGMEDVLAAYRPWEEAFRKGLRQAVDEREKENAIPQETADRLRAFIRDKGAALRSARLALVYADLHFDNLLLDDKGKLYLLDYETLCLAPPDFTLDTWDRMSRYPYIYAGEEDHASARAEDYTCIVEWMCRYAPFLFANPLWETRVALYGIRYDLDILKDYPCAPELLARLEENMCRG